MENNHNIPEKYRAAVLPAYNPNIIRAIIGLKTEEREITGLKPNQVLIKIVAAPCNPSDIAFLQGGYNVVKPLPAVPGFEGAGTVVQTSEEASALLGQRVSCFTQDDGDGTWAEYLATDAKNCIVLKDEVGFDQAACLAINPFTAYGLFELCQRDNCKALVLNAAGGQLAEFVRLLAIKEGVDCINIVRKKEQVDLLKEKGEEYALNSADDFFKDELKIVSNKLNATFAFDAVGGEMTGTLLNAMPSGSEVVVYGGLSGKDISGISTLDIIFQNKKISGFNLNEWIANKSPKELQRIGNEIQEFIVKGDFETKIQGSFKLDDVKEGIRAYIKSMSNGKVLFKP
ncbi:MAG: zinc-binding dehydrogenase [Chlorobi bacterium]|nr:zinc-binding dehydrogenase [Chlorobiota bacterium]